MEKYSIELTRDELVRVIEGLGLLMDEAQEEQDKEKRHNACVLRRQLLEVADGELAEFGGHPELVPTGEEPDEEPEAVCTDDINTRKHVDTVNGSPRPLVKGSAGMSKTSILVLSKDEMEFLRRVVASAYDTALDELLPYYPECLNTAECSEKVSELNTKADKLFDLLNEVSFALIDLPEPDPNDPYPF